MYNILTPTHPLVPTVPVCPSWTVPGWQLLLLAQAEAQQQAAEADADREVAATMRYNSPLDTPSSDAGPQIRGGSAPAASMGAGRASDDSLSLPFSTGLGPDGPLVSSSTVRERTSSLHFRVAQTEN